MPRPTPPAPPQILDFFDTIVIILRGTWGQFSFLHTYHHFTIFLTYWLVANAGMDGDVWYTIVANSFVHMVMYFYYGLKVLGIPVSWDIAVTSLQMFQFLTMNAQAIYILTQNCAYPHRVTAYYLAYIISLFALFGEFFYSKYVKKASKPAAKKA
jgi:elongation of very long chain fatty acids protein 4